MYCSIPFTIIWTDDVEKAYTSLISLQPDCKIKSPDIPPTNLVNAPVNKLISAPANKSTNAPTNTNIQRLQQMFQKS